MLANPVTLRPLFESDEEKSGRLLQYSNLGSLRRMTFDGLPAPLTDGPVPGPS